MSRGRAGATFLAAAALLWVWLLPARAQLPTATIVDGVEFPTGIAFDDSGRMYVNEREGRVRVVVDGELRSESLATIETTTTGESGLLGIAVSPDQRSLFVFATHPSGDTNRVLRVPIEGGSPSVVVDGLPAGVYHNGGGVAFDLDGRLLVSNGEQHAAERAQDPSVLGGKVYRYEPSGDVPQDNPFGDSPALAIGLRNPFGLAVDPVSGTAWVTENGPSSHDEVNRIVAGGNYGWPVVSGPGDPGDLRGDYHDPVLDYEDIIVPTGITFPDPETAPQRLQDRLFFASFDEGTIHSVRLNDARDGAVSDDVLVDEGEPIVALAWGPDGLYYSTTSAIKVVRFESQRRRETPGSPSPSPSPERPSPPEQARAGDGGGLPVLPIALGSAAAVAGAGYLLVRLRR